MACLATPRNLSGICVTTIIVALTITISGLLVYYLYNNIFVAHDSSNAFSTSRDELTHSQDIWTLSIQTNIMSSKFHNHFIAEL
jgi:hypothetical protein